MDSAPLVMLLARDAVIREAHSARPLAPVVPSRPRRTRAPGTRTAVATVLHRVADAVAPAPAPRTGSPAH